MWAVFAFGSAVFAALTSVLAKIGINGVQSNLATAVRTVVVLVMAWGMVFLTDGQGGIASVSRKSWLFLVLSGLATGASWLCRPVNCSATNIGWEKNCCMRRGVEGCFH